MPKPFSEAFKIPFASLSFIIVIVEALGGVVSIITLIGFDTVSSIVLFVLLSIILASTCIFLFSLIGMLFIVNFPSLMGICVPVGIALLSISITFVLSSLILYVLLLSLPCDEILTLTKSPAFAIFGKSISTPVWFGLLSLFASSLFILLSPFISLLNLTPILLSGVMLDIFCAPSFPALSITWVVIVVVELFDTGVSWVLNLLLTIL